VLVESNVRRYGKDATCHIIGVMPDKKDFGYRFPCDGLG